MKRLITMTSITYAVKGQNVLAAAGIKCRVVSTPKNVGSGCGYSLEVDSDVEKAVKMLTDNGIKYKEVF